MALANSSNGDGGGAPSGAAGGDLAGTYPNPTIGAAKVTTAKLASTVTLDAIATANATAADVAMNAHKLTGLANGVAATDSAAFGQIPTALPPNGSAGGDLGGTYPNPKVAAITETSGPTSLVAGTITDGQFLKRVGSTLVSALAPVTSVFGRTGAVTAAASDYSLAQIAAGTNHTIPVSGSSVMGSLAAGTSGQFLVSGGASADPAWETLTWSAAANTANTSTAQTLISASIPGNTLGATGGLLCVISGNYINNSGAGRGLTLLISYGGTTLWSDATTATFFAANANRHGFYMAFVLNNVGATNSQRIGGFINMGSADAASVAGNGTITGAPSANNAFQGSSAVDSTATKTLLVTATNSAADPALGLLVGAHIIALA